MRYKLLWGKRDLHLQELNLTKSIFIPIILNWIITFLEPNVHLFITILMEPVHSWRLWKYIGIDAELVSKYHFICVWKCNFPLRGESMSYYRDEWSTTLTNLIFQFTNRSFNYQKIKRINLDWNEYFKDWMIFLKN
jgi:hypothetical protein